VTRYIIALLACLTLIQAAWSQDAANEDADPPETDTAAEPEPAEVDDSDLDEQVYEDVDDDFRPSEEISTDQSIAFPTDI
jgi:hypothetical protein